MSDQQSTAERLAQNAIFTLIARGAMVLASAALVPAGIGALSTYTEIKLIRSELGAKIERVNQSLTMRIQAVERNDTERARRMDLTDQRIERLTDITNQFAINAAVLTEQMRALLQANTPQPKPGGPR